MKKLTNFLAETLSALEGYDKTEADVLYVSYSHANEEVEEHEAEFISWADFKVMAQCIDYDPGYGGECINTTLRVVGQDFWLERGEYDGSEWWEYKSTPQKPTQGADIFANNAYKKLLTGHGNEVRLNSIEETLSATKDKRLMEQHIPLEDNTYTSKSVLKI